MANRAPIPHIGPPAIAGLSVVVDGSLSEDPDGQIKRWRWTWGDDNTTAGSGHPGRAEHVYDEPGRYDIVLTVTDHKKVSASRTLMVELGTPTPGPDPVDCVLSPWSSWTPVDGPAGQWSACANGTQSRTEERSRTVTTPPANGGIACDPNQHETRTATQACVIPPTPGTRAVVSPADLKFIGFYRFPREVGTLWWATGASTMRKKNGETRIFVRGDHTENFPLWEASLPSEPPTTDANTAPVMVARRNWGSVPTGMISTGGTGWNIGSLGWDETIHAIRWSYGDSYPPVQHHPSQITTVLNDTDGSVRHYGPWRTEWLAQRTAGAFTIVPEWFRQYVNGQVLAVSSHMSSGAAGCAWGASLSALDFPPLNAPPDTTADVNSKQIQNEGIILHTLDNRQKRDTRYRYEDFIVKYDCSKGVTMQAGTNEWGGPAPAAGTGDSMRSVVWIDLPDKHGLVYFGMLVTTPTGYTAPNDPQGYTHMGYAALPKDAQGRHVCCHGQDDPFFGATGPWAHTQVPHCWIYDPVDLIASATGQAALHSRTPKYTVQMRDGMTPWMPMRIHAQNLGLGSVFDPDTRRVYVPFRNDTATHAPHPRPTLMVFEVQ
jgi:hypothetical protein